MEKLWRHAETVSAADAVDGEMYPTRQHQD